MANLNVCFEHKIISLVNLKTSKTDSHISELYSVLHVPQINIIEGLNLIWITKLWYIKIARPDGVYHPGLSLQHWVFLLLWPENRAATHNEARLLGQKSILPWNGNQKALIAVPGPYRCPGCPSRAQPSGKLSRNQEWGKKTPDWKHPQVMLTTLSPYQTPCRSHAVIHLLQNNSFVLSFPSLWQKGTKAPQAAGKIHTDFEKGFIMAEVMKFQDFKEEGSENAVKVSSQGARGDEGKSPVISEADSHHTAPTANCSSPLLRGRNYCTHSSTTPDKPTDSGSKHCHSAPAVHIFITMCLNWLMVVLAFSSAQLLRGSASLPRQAFIRSIDVSLQLSVTKSPSHCRNVTVM